MLYLILTSLLILAGSQYCLPSFQRHFMSILCTKFMIWEVPIPFFKHLAELVVVYFLLQLFKHENNSIMMSCFPNSFIC